MVAQRVSWPGFKRQRWRSVLEWDSLVARAQVRVARFTVSFCIFLSKYCYDNVGTWWASWTKWREPVTADGQTQFKQRKYTVTDLNENAQYFQKLNRIESQSNFS